jgi:TetR/AcrR family transcriptional regulator
MGIPERKEREKLKRRIDIIDAAEKVFFRKGFESTTMDEVADEAELSKGTLYLYFRSKEDLQFAIFMRGLDILLDKMRKSLSEKDNGYQGLRKLAASFIRFSEEHEYYFNLLMYYESSRMEALKIDQEQLQVYLKEQSPLALVTQQVTLGMQDGSLRSDLPAEVFSATLWSQMLGVLIVLNSKADLYEIFNLRANEILQTHMELVSNGSIPKN